MARLEGQRLVVTDRGEHFTPAFVADLDQGSTEIAVRRFDSQEPWTTLYRSASCGTRCLDQRARVNVS